MKRKKGVSDILPVTKRLTEKTTVEEIASSFDNLLNWVCSKICIFI